jgi:hypothetical protein
MAAVECAHCGATFHTPGKGRPAKYCSNRCKRAVAAEHRKARAPVKFAPIPREDWDDWDDLDNDDDLSVQGAPPRTPTELAARIGSQLTTIASRIKDRSKLTDRDIEVLIAPSLGELVVAFDDRMVYHRKGSA